MATEMQKEKNVNTRWLFITILFGINLCFSQSVKMIEGRYVIDNVSDWVAEAGVYTYFNFTKNGTFKKEVMGELGREHYTQGEYKLSKDQLILNYNKTVPLKMSYHISEIWESNKDSITVDFDLFDFDGNPATGVEILYKDSLSKRGYRADVSNKDGRSSFKLKRDPSELQFEISSMDYGLTNSIRHTIYYLTIYREWNYKISVYLQKSYIGIPVLNRTDTLKLKKVREKHFEVINDNGSVTTWRKLED